MKKILLFLVVILFSIVVKAQPHISDGYPRDSTTFTFETFDSLSHTFGKLPYQFKVNIDTTNTHLWRIGKTRKPFFSLGTDTSFAIMTDTSKPYPKNANDWFVIKIDRFPANGVIDFLHKYQTTKGHDGGIVEFSIDTGLTWQNVKGSCNVDSSAAMFGVHTDGFYAKTDTLLTGQQAFSGTSSGWQYSRLQFFNFIPVRITKGTSGCSFPPEILIRFRFVSDSISDTLDGWIINNIKIEADSFGGGFVPTVGSYHTLDVYPNPSQDGIFVFPALNDEKNAEIEVYSMLGEKLFMGPYSHKIDLSNYPRGLYLYKVKSSTEYYSGRLGVQ